MIGTLSCIFSCTGNSLTVQSRSSLREVFVCPEDNLITSVKTGDVYFLLGNAANGKPSGDGRKKADEHFSMAVQPSTSTLPCAWAHGLLSLLA